MCRHDYAQVLVVSYPRFEEGHPDESGLLLHRLLPILKACVKEAKKHVKTASVRAPSTAKQ